MRRPLALLLLALSLSACAGLTQTAAASVGGRTIDEERFTRELDFILADPRLAQQIPQGAQGDVRRKDIGRQFLTFLIHQQIVHEYAEQRGIEVDQAEVQTLLDQQIESLGGREAYVRLLAEAGVTDEDVRRLLEEQLLRDQVANAVVEEQVSEEQLRATYEERQLEFAEVHTAHILVPTEAEARDILKRATPENFADLAQRFSQDQGSAPNGGDLGPQRAADLVEPYARAAMEIPVGEVGGPVATQYGFHLIHVLDRQAPRFEEVRDQLVGELRGDVFTQWLLERLRGTEVRVNPRYGTFDEQTGRVVERRSTTPLPSPSVQLFP